MTIGDATELLLVPFTLAVVAYVFSAYQRRQDRKIAADQQKQDREIAERERYNDRKIARDRNEEAELQTYFDRMSELMLTHNLRPSSSSNEDEDEEQPDETKATALHNSTASTIARARTLAVLRSVKSRERKASVVRFLYESGLIHKEGTVVDLSGADLSGADLFRTDLKWTDMKWADLSWTDLFETNLSGADLSGANLEGADLREADLREADLSGARLLWADLSGANLEGADLSGAVYDDTTTPPLSGFPDNAINVERGRAETPDKHPTGTR
jgi:uncharacterized protein YjbI with pentapeptide repeats